jgi:probable HAF family extracellular repeat protein
MIFRTNASGRPGGVRRSVAVIAIATVGGLVVPAQISSAETFSYRVDDLGTLTGDTGSTGLGINAGGQVVGWSVGPTGTHAFVFTDGVGMTPLAGPAGRPNTVARDINDLGVVVGSASTGGTDIGHAVRWTNGVAQDLGTLGTGLFSETKSINASGTSVGYSYTNGGGLSGVHAFQTGGKGLIDLTPTADTANAESINASGQIAGSRNGRAFRLAGGVFTDLGVPVGFLRSYGFAINDSGQVAGHVVSPTGSSQQIFRYTTGAGMVVLGGVGNQNQAFGINGAGDVVGVGRPASALFVRAFVFTDEGGMVDLNTLIDPASGWLVLGAGAINDAGQIAAWGSNQVTGARHALRLTPDTASGDTTPPTVRFETPADGAIVAATVDVSIVALDDVAISQVSLIVDGVTKCSTTTSSRLVCPWRTAKTPIGLHTLTAVAVDSSGNRSSQAITVTVRR